MTAEMAKNALQILQGYYPGEAYKLTGVSGKRFADVMLAVFAKTDDYVVLKALKAVCDESDMLPSITMIRKAVKAIGNRVPEYQSLPEGTVSVVGKERIAEIMSEAKKRWAERQQKQYVAADPNDADYYRLPDELVRFARRKFPDISLQRIYDNQEEFEWNYRQRGQCDGLPLGLVINKYTGDIYNHVYVPAEQLRRMK